MRVGGLRIVHPDDPVGLGDLLDAVAGQFESLQAGGDRLYRGEGEINGRAISGVVDTGASVMVVPAAQARRLGLPEQGGREVDVQTAAGIVTSVITTRSVRELELRVGSEVIAFVKSTEVSIAKL